MAFLVCYSHDPPHDHPTNRAIYLDQSFYEMIFRECRRPDSDYVILKEIASLRYKSPTLVLSQESLEILQSELDRLDAHEYFHSRIAEFKIVIGTAINRNCSLTISGDMYREL